MRNFIESGKLTKIFNTLRSKKTLDCKLHFILAIGAIGLVYSGVHDAETHGWLVPAGKIASGAMSSIRNFWQMHLLSRSTPETRNKNQALSNNISCATHTPQAIWSLAAGRWTDFIAASIAITTYKMRAILYKKYHKNGNAAILPPKGALKNIFFRNEHRIPGIAMISRSIAQGITAPISGGCYFTVGVIMLCTDFNHESNGAPQKPHQKQSKEPTPPTQEELYI